MRSTKFMGAVMLLTGIGMLIWAAQTSDAQVEVIYRYIAGGLLTLIGVWITLKKKPG